MVSRSWSRAAFAGLFIMMAVVVPADAATRTYEKTINLDISKRVRAGLKEAGVKVTMTRSTDKTLDPSDRTGLANRLGVDAFVSIHNNAASTKSAAGSIVFHSIRKDGSAKLGDRIRDGLRDELGADRRAQLATRRGCCGDYYFQLRQPRMPAALVEGGFLTNPTEGRRLATSASYRQAVADGIVAGILRYQKGLAAKRAPNRDPGTRVIGPMPPPTAGTARALGATRVALSWETAAGVEAYRIYRGGKLLATRRASADLLERKTVTMTDGWAAPGQRYTYEIRGTDKLADGITLESAPLELVARTPAISVVLDPGHGGRDPGAVVSY